MRIENMLSCFCCNLCEAVLQNEVEAESLHNRKGGAKVEAAESKFYRHFDMSK